MSITQYYTIFYGTEPGTFDDSSLSDIITFKKDVPPIVTLQFNVSVQSPSGMTYYPCYIIAPDDVNTLFQFILFSIRN